ncbi:dienelactone hydrolase family protein [Flavihumibacter stibioxidans]|uniref:Carboxymethylenebutenolidase n=1 Tax=Flavihumibacter stibioxidans TaxID=1834163 RepID=A0ABR7M9A8_9BACT|nr:dienelactone hydrolase family protein [Flavihumibacter stibioxidans]MBC6491183.1 carboxymethylenebutenolidase [Flavihumibacter stibioxidans]
MDQRIISLYDEYTHRPLGRDQFLKQLVKITGSLTAAMAVLPMLEGNYASAQTQPAAGLFTERVSYPSSAGEMKAYVARPVALKPYAAIIVIHENRGLNAHIEDVARRAAAEGFLAIAPDGLSTLGGTPANEDDARQLFSKLDGVENITRFGAALPYLRTRKDCNGAVGCVGFCWGGAMSNNLAVAVPELKAAVSFYGRQPDAAKVANIRAAVQLHYAALDERVNAGMAAYEESLKAAGIKYEQYVYEGVNHAFHNDTSAARYNKEAALLAWSRTISFFKKHLVI